MIFQILFLLLNLQISGNERITSSEKNSAKKEFTLYGKIMQTNQHQGGMYNPQEPIPYPMNDLVLKVIRIDDPNKTPIVVGQVQSDVNGRFEIKLPPGKYGFIGVNENPVKGQFLPAAFVKTEDFYQSSSSWTSNLPVPIEIKDQDIIGLHIINHRSSICMLCP